MAPEQSSETGRRAAEPTPLERAALASEASRAITVAIGAETNLDRILELIVQRGRRYSRDSRARAQGHGDQWLRAAVGFAV